MNVCSYIHKFSVWSHAYTHMLRELSSMESTCTSLCMTIHGCGNNTNNCMRFCHSSTTIHIHVCVCTSIHTYTCMCLYKHAHIHMYVSVQPHTHTHTHMYVSVQPYTYTHAYTYTHVSVFTYTYNQTHTLMCLSPTSCTQIHTIHLCVHTLKQSANIPYPHVNAHTHAYKHIYIHTCIFRHRTVAHSNRFVQKPLTCLFQNCALY
jgi:hypothetical protein